MLSVLGLLAVTRGPHTLRWRQRTAAPLPQASTELRGIPWPEVRPLHPRIQTPHQWFPCMPRKMLSDFVPSVLLRSGSHLGFSNPDCLEFRAYTTPEPNCEDVAAFRVPRGAGYAVGSKRAVAQGGTQVAGCSAEFCGFWFLDFW